MKRIFILTLALALAGCAGTGANYVPLIDQQSSRSGNYAQDLADCQRYAAQRADAATGAVVGAVAGAILGAILGGGRVTRFGAAAGALQGASESSGNQQAIVSRCMAGRGYTVLD